MGEHRFQLRRDGREPRLLGRHPFACRLQPPALGGAVAARVVRLQGGGDLVQGHAQALELPRQPDPGGGGLGVDAVARRQPPGRSQQAAALVVAHGVDADPGLPGHGADPQLLTLDHGPDFTVAA